MNKKYILFTLLSSLLLVGCNSNETPSINEVDSSLSSTSEIVTSEDSSSSISSSNSSKDTTSSIDSSVSSNSNSSIDSSSSSTSSSSSDTTEETQQEKVTIKKIKEKAQEFKDQRNEVGYYQSDILVKLNLQLISTVDTVTPKANSQFKALMSDGEDYIYVNLDLNSYKSLKEYTSDYSTYEVEGYISWSYDEVEIKASKKPVYLKDKIIIVNYFEMATPLTLEETYVEINKMSVNYKGCAYGKLVKIDVQCLAKDINNTNMIFGSGNTIIGVHGNDKVTNFFRKGLSYTVVGALSMYNQRPGLEYVAHIPNLNKVPVDFKDIETKTPSEFYNYKYIKDTTAKNKPYTDLFMKPYKVSGYANYYMKDGSGNMVIDEKYNSSYYNRYENARDKKSLFIANENYQKLDDTNTEHCPLYSITNEDVKVDFIIFPYLWNSQKYPLVYVYDFVVPEV